MLQNFLPDLAGTFLWSVAASISMCAALGLMMKFWDKVITPTIDESEELKKGNVAVAIVMAAVIVSCAIVVAVILMPGSTLISGAH
ncbi:MAG: DUF350 domain-containing protein [bacterium]|nr:DUF350 domain-containing protein [bacterium]